MFRLFNVYGAIVTLSAVGVVTFLLAYHNTGSLLTPKTLDQRQHPVVAGAPSPSPEIQANCHLLYPRQPDMEQACLARWTAGTPMPGLDRDPTWNPLPSAVPPQAARDGYMNSPYFEYCVQWAPGGAPGSPTPLQDRWRQTLYCIDKAEGRL